MIWVTLWMICQWWSNPAITNEFLLLELARAWQPLRSSRPLSHNNSNNKGLLISNSRFWPFKIL
jgi:hypothetical protein